MSGMPFLNVTTAPVVAALAEAAMMEGITDVTTGTTPTDVTTGSTPTDITTGTPTPGTTTTKKASLQEIFYNYILFHVVYIMIKTKSSIDKFCRLLNKNAGVKGLLSPSHETYHRFWRWFMEGPHQQDCIERSFYVFKSVTAKLDNIKKNCGVVRMYTRTIGGITKDDVDNTLVCAGVAKLDNIKKNCGVVRMYTRTIDGTTKDDVDNTPVCAGVVNTIDTDTIIEAAARKDTIIEAAADTTTVSNDGDVTVAEDGRAGKDDCMSEDDDATTTDKDVKKQEMIDAITEAGVTLTIVKEQEEVAGGVGGAKNKKIKYSMSVSWVGRECGVRERQTGSLEDMREFMMKPEILIPKGPGKAMMVERINSKIEAIRMAGVAVHRANKMGA